MSQVKKDTRNEISITIKNEGEEYVVKTYMHEYRNIMALINNSIYLENFGMCGGQGRCATCLVKAVGLKGNAGMERNETVTIMKTGAGKTGIRLSCQLLINEELDGAVIDIVSDGY